LEKDPEELKKTFTSCFICFPITDNSWKEKGKNMNVDLKKLYAPAHGRFYFDKKPRPDVSYNNSHI